MRTGARRASLRFQSLAEMDRLHCVDTGLRRSSVVDARPHAECPRPSRPTNLGVSPTEQHSTAGLDDASILMRRLHCWSSSFPAGLQPALISLPGQLEHELCGATIGQGGVPLPLPLVLPCSGLGTYIRCTLTDSDIGVVFPVAGASGSAPRRRKMSRRAQTSL